MFEELRKGSENEKAEREGRGCREGGESKLRKGRGFLGSPKSLRSGGRDVGRGLQGRVHC